MIQFWKCQTVIKSTRLKFSLDGLNQPVSVKNYCSALDLAINFKKSLNNVCMTVIKSIWRRRVRCGQTNKKISSRNLELLLETGPFQIHADITHSGYNQGGDLSWSLINFSINIILEREVRRCEHETKQYYPTIAREVHFEVMGCYFRPHKDVRSLCGG